MQMHAQFFTNLRSLVVSQVADQRMRSKFDRWTSPVSL